MSDAIRQAAEECAKELSALLMDDLLRNKEFGETEVADIIEHAMRKLVDAAVAKRDAAWRQSLFSGFASPSEKEAVMETMHRKRRAT